MVYKSKKIVLNLVNNFVYDTIWIVNQQKLKSYYLGSTGMSMYVAPLPVPIPNIRPTFP